MSTWIRIGQDVQRQESHHNFGNSHQLRKQDTSNIALSSAEAELYAINTGATEALHIRNLLMELLKVNRVNIKIHTDSSSGRAWQQESAHQEKQSTLTSDTCSYNSWSHTTSWESSKSTQMTTRPTYSPSMSPQRLCNATLQAGLRVQPPNFLWATAATVSPQLVTYTLQHARAQYTLVFVSQTMGSTIVDQPFAVPTSLSISRWYLIKFVYTIFVMNISNKFGQHDGVHDLNMSVEHNMFSLLWNSTVICFCTSLCSQHFVDNRVDASQRSLLRLNTTGQQSFLQPSYRKQGCQQPSVATWCVPGGTRSSWAQHRDSLCATCSTMQQRCMWKVTVGNRPSCWQLAPTTSNRRDASDLVPSISSTEVTTWAHRCRVKLDTSSAWQQTRSQQFSCGTSQPTPLEATFSRRLPTQPAGNKVLFGTTAHPCQFNRWPDLNMDGFMLSSTVWSTPEFRLSTEWHLKFNNMWAWSCKISTHCNQASNILTS